MLVGKIGTRGLLFAFNDPYLTNVYVIIGKERVFVLDTSLGPEPMRIVTQTLEEEGYGSRPVVVFNSHGDYDHYWGNAAMKDALIIGHEQCRARILTEGEALLIKYKDHKRGAVIIKAPSLVFADRLRFTDESITFFHSPGHTIDSSSCFDEVDKVLFVGDNIESPLPYIYNTNVAQFSTTLKSYCDIEWKLMIASHDPPLSDRTLLEKNMEYLMNLQDWSIDLSTFSNNELHLHSHNVHFLEENLDQKEISSQAKQHFVEMKKVKHL